MYRLNEEARNLIADLGSSSISILGFRDNWVFVGGKGIKTKSPFEQVNLPCLFFVFLKLQPPLMRAHVLFKVWNNS